MKLFDKFDKYTPATELTKYSEAEILGMRVDKELRMLEVDISSSIIIPKRDLYRIEAEIQEAYNLNYFRIHPKYNKEMSTGITTYHQITPAQVVIPLQQHIGSPCTPLVKVGDQVLIGQKIGDGEGLCVPVHASVSGTVVAIEPRPHTRGGLVNAVVIENDFKNETVTMPHATNDDEILHSIREAGIVGMGGAAFPGNVKALGAMGNVDTLIANGCECEPYITADDTLLRTSPEQVLEGMLILRSLLDPKRTVLAVEAIEKVKSLHREFPDIELAVLPTMYPQGAEKQLIQAVTGRQVPPGQLPVKVGCAVFNVSTFAAICRAATEGKAVEVTVEAGDPAPIVQFLTGSILPGCGMAEAKALTHMMVMAYGR